MENRLFEPSIELSKNSRIKNMCEYKALCKEAEQDFEGFWARYAKEKISWKKMFNEVLDESDAPFYKWFNGGILNISEQCIDRHLAAKKNKAAIIFEGELGDKRVITYRELHHEVNKAANLLKNEFNIKKGDRVVIYMPMIPETAVMMLACARIGAIHSVVFGGFSAEALRDRIVDVKARLVITADGAFRRGAPYMLKPIVDDALNFGCESVEKVLIVLRNNEEISYIKGRDYVYNELIKDQSFKCEAQPMNSEDLFFLLYTSGSTGKPKGVEHTTAGYILWAQMTMEWVFDVKEDDTYWCTADLGWITGHTYILYGPLAMGATTIMYEGVPVYPDAGRWWKMIEEYKVTHFYTAPTAIRMLKKVGHDEPLKYDLSTLRILGSVGEPINPEAWMWYYEKIGKSKCPIIDTYWQTETGGHMITPLPGATPLKPACATLPLPGIIAEIVDIDGNKVPVGEKGLMCFTKPWPSMIRGVWGDPQRYKNNYFGHVKKDGKPVYFTGDGAIYDENGYITITGRTDDVLNVSGHRLGTAEIEAEVSSHPNIAECAVVGKPDEIKGESVFIYAVLKNEDGFAEEVDMIKEINAIITKRIGSIAKADSVVFVPGLPKTRSGKIMRRLLRALAKGEEITQDTSSLEDQSIIEKIKNCLNKA